MLSLYSVLKRPCQLDIIKSWAVIQVSTRDRSIFIMNDMFAVSITLQKPNSAEIHYLDRAIRYFKIKIYIWIFGLICERLEKWTWFASNLFLQQRLRLSWCQICALIWGMSCLKNIINSTGNHYRSNCYSCPLACLKYSTADHKTPHN